MCRRFVLLLLIFLHQHHTAVGCFGGAGKAVSKVGTEIAKTSMDDITGASARIAAEAMKNAGTALGKGNLMLRSLAKASTDVPSEIPKLLKDLPDLAMDKTMREIVSESLERVAAEGGDIGNPSFWSKTVSYLKQLKITRTAKVMDDLAESTVTGLKEFEPEDLIQLQRVTDEAVSSLTSLVDDILDETAEAAAEIYARKTGGAIFSAASQKMSTIADDMGKGLNEYAKFDVETIAGMKKANVAAKEAADDVLKAVDEQASLGTLASKYSNQLEATRILKETIDEFDMQMLDRGIAAEAKRKIPSARVYPETLDEFLARSKSVVPKITPEVSQNVGSNIKKFATNVVDKFKQSPAAQTAVGVGAAAVPVIATVVEVVKAIKGNPKKEDKDVAIMDNYMQKMHDEEFKTKGKEENWNDDEYEEYDDIITTTKKPKRKTTITTKKPEINQTTTATDAPIVQWRRKTTTSKPEEIEEVPRLSIEKEKENDNFNKWIKDKSNGDYIRARRSVLEDQILPVSELDKLIYDDWVEVLEAQTPLSPELDKLMDQLDDPYADPMNPYNQFALSETSTTVATTAAAVIDDITVKKQLLLSQLYELKKQETTLRHTFNDFDNLMIKLSVLSELHKLNVTATELETIDDYINHLTEVDIDIKNELSSTPIEKLLLFAEFHRPVPPEFMGFKLLTDVWSARSKVEQADDVNCYKPQPLANIPIVGAITALIDLIERPKVCDDKVQNANEWVRLNLNVASEEEWNMQETIYQKALTISSPGRKKALQAGRRNFELKNPFKEERLWKMRMSALKLESDGSNTGGKISFIMIFISFLLVTCVK